MDQPSNLLRELAARGRRIQADLLAARESKRSATTNAALGVEALDIFFDFSGRKRLAQTLGKRIAHSSADGRLAKLEDEVNHWINDTKETLRGISVFRRGVPAKPNSDQLVRSFSGIVRFARPDTRLYHGITYLEELADRSIVFNKDLEQTRKAVDIIEQAAPTIPPEIESGSEEMLLLVSPFRSEHEAISGAMIAYKSKGPDWQRQTADSLRNALENLVKRLSGEDDWSLGLTKIIPSDVGRKPIRDTYNLLSAKGVHAQDVPSNHEISFCIGLTQKAIKYIVDSHVKRQQS